VINGVAFDIIVTLLYELKKSKKGDDGIYEKFIETYDDKIQAV